MIYSNKRSEIEIINIILNTAQNEVKKTYLMYQTNLCYNHFSQYISFLLEKDLICKDKTKSSSDVYYTTKKGREVLSNLNLLFKIINEN